MSQSIVQETKNEEHRVLKKLEGAGAKGANGTKKGDCTKVHRDLQSITVFYTDFMKTKVEQNLNLRLTEDTIVHYTTKHSARYMRPNHRIIVRIWKRASMCSSHTNWRILQRCKCQLQFGYLRMSMSVTVWLLKDVNVGYNLVTILNCLTTPTLCCSLYIFYHMFNMVRTFLDV